MLGRHPLSHPLLALLLAAAAILPARSLAADPDFSLVVLPDTQYYSKNTPAVYSAQTSWIVSRRDAGENIQFVLHMGDITDQNLEAQWAVASKAHAVLEGAGIPYAVLPGNHDYSRTASGALGRSLTLLNDHFPPSRFTGKPWYGGHYGTGNESNYSLFEVGGLKFLAINLEFAPRKDVLCWANRLAEQHADRRVIVSTHCYQASAAAGTAPSGHRTDCGPAYNLTGSAGDDVWRELVRRHNNIFLVLSGHIHDSEHRVRSGLAPGHVVHEILTDYQRELPGGAGTSGGNGWLRLLRFFPAGNRVDALSETVVQPETAYYESFFPDGVLFYTTGVYSSNPLAPDHRFSFAYDMTAPLPAHTTHPGTFEPFNDRTVNSISAGQQLNPAVALSTAGPVVAWQDDQDGNGKFQILARGFDPTGCERFHDLTVNAASAGQQEEPSIAGDASGNFVVVWRDDQDGDGNYDIYARGFTAGGVQRFEQLRVNPTTTGQHRKPRVAMDAAGNFVVVWEDDSDGNGFYQIHGRGFFPTGAQRIASFTVNSIADGQQLSPAIAMSSAGAFAVTWEDDSDDNGYFQILVRGFYANGSQRFPDRTVNSASAGQQRRPAAAMDSSGGFVVAWEDDQDGDGYNQILARGFTASGAPRFADLTINTVDAGQSLGPQVAADTNGNVVVIWQDQDDNGDYQLLARGLHANGTQRFGPLEVSSGANGQQRRPAVSTNASGQFVVAWEDDIDGNGVYQIVARGFSAMGAD